MGVYFKDSAVCVSRSKGYIVLNKHNGSLQDIDVLLLKSLHCAAYIGNDSLIRDLIKGGCKPNQKDEKGRLALHYAAEKGHEKACEILIEHSQNIDGIDINGETPLRLVIKNGMNNTGSQLLEEEASLKKAISAEYDEAVFQEAYNSFS